MSLPSQLLPGRPAAVQQTSSNWTISIRAGGPLAIGMPIAEVRHIIVDSSAYLVQALHQDHELPREPDASDCDYLATNALPSQLGLMFQQGRLVRVDVWQPGISTSSGAHAGDSEARIRDLYGARLKVTQHHYPPVGAHYMTVTPVDEDDREYLQRFETAGNKVTRFRIGLRKAVDKVEGCL